MIKFPGQKYSRSKYVEVSDAAQAELRRGNVIELACWYADGMFLRRSNYKGLFFVRKQNCFSSRSERNQVNLRL